MANTIFHFFPNQYFIDLCLYQYGYEQCTSLSSFGPFIRNHYLFHYIISGSGTLIAADNYGKDQTFHIRSGQGFIIFPDRIHIIMLIRNIPGNIPGLNLMVFVWKKSL